MPNPLSQVTYNQEAGYLPINMVAGDSLVMTVAIPFDITDYSFVGAVLDQFGTELFTLTIDPTQLTPTGILTITAGSDDTATIPTGATYYVQWSLSGDIRTFLAGPIVSVPK